MPKHKTSVRYNNQKNLQFQQTFKKRVDRLIASRGGNIKSNLFLQFRVVILLAAHLCLWSLLALQAHSLTVSIALLVAFAFLSQTIICNIVHESGHNAITGNKKIDDAITWFGTSLLGPNPRLYQIKHNEAHHMFTNIPGLDTDIESNTVIRFLPHVEWKPYHRFQHIYAPILYSLFSLQWVFISDFKTIKLKELGNLTNVTHTRTQVVSLYVMKLAYLALMIGVPALALPYGFGTILAGFVFYHLFLSCMLTLTIASLHIFTGTEFIAFNEKGELPYSFIEHALRTSADFYPTSRLFGFFYSAFNTHTIHHIFPNMSSEHYPAISKILKTTAKEFGLPYHEFSLFQLIKSHLSFLKYMGTSQEAGRECITHPLELAVAPDAVPGLRLDLSGASDELKQSKHLVS